MLFQIKRVGPPGPEIFSSELFNGTPHPLVRLELAEELAAVLPFVSWSKCFRMIVILSVLVSATTAKFTRCYLYMYVGSAMKKVEVNKTNGMPNQYTEYLNLIFKTAKRAAPTLRFSRKKLK